MKKNYKFIWDLDGTLLDSYEIIVNCLQKTYKEYDILLSKEYILDHIIKDSVKSFMKEISEEYNILLETVNERYSQISNNEKDNIKLIKHAKEILDYIVRNGMENFVFTHRGQSAITILKKNGIFSYFKEIINGENGFPRKPAPDAIKYLINKYNLSKDYTFYVGDRLLDIECANNANIRSIMFIPSNSVAQPSGIEEIVIKDLLEIKEIMK